MNENTPKEKSQHALREEAILAYWKEKGIADKSISLGTNGGKAKKEFIFYEGPPTANGRPGIHHLEARAFKDAIPRYKIMRGYHVRRKGGWDTHGLPVELQVEKELGLKSKKEIEKYGIAEFNQKCRESVWTYVKEWEGFTQRMGYWVDLKNPYVTYKNSYIESVWNIIKTVEEKDLLYKDYKVVPWCPRCGTGLSSHELAQGYSTVKDLSVTVKFKIIDPQKNSLPENTFILAWTTTPWTLPGNVGLAVNEKIEYVLIKTADANLILAKDRSVMMKDVSYENIKTLSGKELVGMTYEPLYPFLKDNISGKEKEKMPNAYKVYAADFVTTTDGTGVVHTAVMYGQDDFELGTKVGLPKYHLVNEDGHFRSEAGFLAGAFVKDPETDVSIIKDLAGRGLLFAKEKYEHSYPFCWRCKTPLIYFARDSWYIKMSELRNKLVAENKDINWEPSHIKEGRFGEWLREIKDWAISRERYWGTPLPVWTCGKCGERKVAGSLADVSRESKNTYYVMRHGEAENNVKNILNSNVNKIFNLTEKGVNDVTKTAKSLKKANIDIIFSSPITRTKQTAETVKKVLVIDAPIIVDERLREIGMGTWEGRDSDLMDKEMPIEIRFDSRPENGENYLEIKRRVGSFLYELENSYSGKNVLIVTHGAPAMMIMAASKGMDKSQSIKYFEENYILKAEVRKLEFSVLPHNGDFEADLHRPYIDEVKLTCKCGGEMNRVKEVMDVWFDSGAMPFAEDHYPFENKKYLDKTGFPADFISEAIDQTRGWFYTLHAIGVLMGKGQAFRNVICLGHILDPQGKKMSKSLGNIVNPWDMMDKYGADALRLWMYSVNQPGDSKNFEEKTVDEINKKVFNLAQNVLAFYEMYAGPGNLNKDEILKPSNNILDKWILERLNELLSTVTEGLENYKFFEPTRAIRDFIADLSQWYLRRSRDRFKSDNVQDKNEALMTTRTVLLELSKIMAPFAPFFAEHLYRGVGGEKESVHFESWTLPKKVLPKDSKHSTLGFMEAVRSISSKGLEARMAAKINVRQPLGQLKIKNNLSIPKEYEELIKDEINVKSLVWEAKIENEVELDTTITPELKEEGDLRELMRKIQDMRKEKGLKVNDVAVLIATSDLKDLISKNESLLKNSTKLSSIEYGEVFGLK